MLDLKDLENQTIYIVREVYAEFKTAVDLFPILLIAEWYYFYLHHKNKGKLESLPFLARCVFMCY